MWVFQLAVNKKYLRKMKEKVYILLFCTSTHKVERIKSEMKWVGSVFVLLSQFQWRFRMQVMNPYNVLYWKFFTRMSVSWDLPVYPFLHILVVTISASKGCAMIGTWQLDWLRFELMTMSGGHSFTI